MTHLFWLLLLGIYGACVGSFLNVVIYRLPADKSLIRPGSACPHCAHKLAWFDNVPVFAWLWLRGRCRYCQAPISIQYPIVELVTALMFAGLYGAYYMSGWRPDFIWGVGVERATALDCIPGNPFVMVMATWPALLAHLVLLGGLLAASVIDARHYIIPLTITWAITVVALVLYPLGALFQGIPTQSGLMIGAHVPAIAPSAWSHYFGAIAGGMVGLLVANVLLHFGWVRRSFEDDSIEPEAAAGSSIPGPAAVTPDQARPVAADSGPAPAPVPAAATPAGVEAGGGPQTCPAQPTAEEVRMTGASTPPGDLSAAVPVLPAAPGDPAVSAATPTTVPAATPAGPDHGTPEQWLAYPHARREVLVELLFVGWPVLGALLGHRLIPQWQVQGVGNLAQWQRAEVLAVHVLAGVCAGYLIGGGLIWLTRILGTLAFGKEAMGLGDVHLLAAIGAVLGARDATLVFFIAPFLGLLGAMMAYGLSRMVKGQVRVIPYGPHLAVAAVIMMVFRGPIVGWLSSQWRFGP